MNKKQDRQNPAPALTPLQRFFIDMGPIALFMLVYNLGKSRLGEQALYVATGVLMASTLAALAYSWIKERRLAPMPLITAVLVVVFGGLTLILQDGHFIKMKPTVIYLLFAAALLGSLFVRRNILKTLLGQNMDLPDQAWRSLTLRWGLWFVFMAVLNEIIWRNFSETFWVNFKFWGVLPLTFLFLAFQAPLIMKYQKQDESRS